MLSRRALLVSTVANVANLSFLSALLRSDKASRSSLARRYQNGCKEFGALTSERDLADVDRERIIAETCGFITIAGPLYWSIAEPRRGVVRFDGARRIAQWAEKNQLPVHGHTLVWHQMEPDWLAEVTTPEDARATLESRIRSTLESNPAISSWDVVNEPLRLRDGNTLGLRTSRWNSLLGVDYIAHCIRLARSVAPMAKLGINETRIEADSAEHRSRRASLLALVRHLSSVGAAPDYVGIQGHLVEGDTYSARGVGDLAKCLGDLGVSSRVSELDFRETGTAASDVTDRRAANAVGEFLSVVRASGHLTHACCWGLFDDTSWLEQVYPHTNGILRRPLPFGRDNLQKPMLPSIHRALECES